GPEVELPAPGEDPRRERPGDDPARNAESGEPRECVRAVRLADDRQDRPDGVLGVDRPLIDHVVEPATDERRDRDDDQRVADDLLVLAAPLRFVDEDEVDGGEADRVADPVPVDRERPDREGDGVRRDVDHLGASVRGVDGARPEAVRGAPAAGAGGPPYTGPRMASSPPPRSAVDA